MTPDEANDMLKQLSEHFREPVMPVSKYCGALYEWQKALSQNDFGREHAYGNPAGMSLAAMVGTVFAAISKSNLLARLIYGGERLRTKKCPVHDGHWSGCSFSDDVCDCQMMEDGEYGSNVTGWLPEQRTNE